MSAKRAIQIVGISCTDKKQQGKERFCNGLLFQQRNTYHFRQPSCRRNISRMYQPVQMPGRLLNLLSHIVVAIQIKDVGDEVKSILVVLDVGVETGEVEAIGQVILVDFAEVLVASGGDKLRAYNGRVS